MENASTRKAGIGQVAKTIFFALLMVGRKDHWEKDGRRVTMAQMVVGAVVGAVVVIATLVSLVHLATS